MTNNLRELIKSFTLMSSIAETFRRNSGKPLISQLEHQGSGRGNLYFAQDPEAPAKH